MKVLDLGCGIGNTPEKLGLPKDWEIEGCDINGEVIIRAEAAHPDRKYLTCSAENLYYSDNTFDWVVANVSLPYMQIHLALAEIYRVLKPGGTLWASYHPWKMVLGEILDGRIRRMPVMWRGLRFHFSGKSVAESFQTQRGLVRALHRFNNITFSRDEKRWIVTARKPLCN